MKYYKVRIAVAAAVLAAMSAGVVIADDDEPQKRIEKKKKTIRAEVQLRVEAPGKYWIGVHALPIDDALKLHLDLPDRLMVHSIIPDSPAAKAELKQFDILLDFAGEEISSLHDLIHAVQEGEEKPVTIKILRGGKEMDVELEPAERPSGDVTKLLSQNVHLEHLLSDALGKNSFVWRGGPLRYQFVGPGVFTETPKKGSLPGNLSISVTRSGDKRARIVVKRDAEEWETTEDSLDELPEDVRIHVRKVLRGQNDLTIGVPHDRPLRVQSFTLRDHKAEPENVIVQRRRVVGNAPAGSLRALTEEIETIRERLDVDVLKELRDELKAVRRDIDKIKESLEELEEDES